MPRSIWSGTIEFGLVSIPISLTTATENKSISFHQLHDKCGTRIKEQRYCPHCERVVEYDEIEKGYEYSKGHYVKVTKEDIERLPLPSKKVIVLNNFVKQEEIDPIYFNGSYYAEPDKAAERPYSLLIATLQKNSLVALGTLALRNKERLCCIRVYEDALVVEILLYPDEIRNHPSHKVSGKVTDKELAVADHLVKLMSGKFEPEEYKDTYREALQKVIEDKTDGQETIVDDTPRAHGGKVLDLMEALQASINSAKNPKRDSNNSSKKSASGNAHDRAAGTEADKKESTARTGAKKPEPAKSKSHPAKKEAAEKPKSKSHRQPAARKKRGAA